MTGRLRRGLGLALIVLLVQGLAVLAYLGVERQRAGRQALPFRFERVAAGRTAPDLLLSRPDGSTRRLVALRGRSVLLHFWATWCPPCREELPGLLALGRDRSGGRNLEVVAVVLDQDWAAVRRFFQGEIPPEVVQDRGAGGRRLYDLSTLPDTYLIDHRGQLLLRFAGARDWRGEAARRLLLSWRR